MIRRFSVTIAVFLVFVASGIVTRAHAECPQRAVQTLFEIKHFVDTNGIVTQQQIDHTYGYANEGLTKCEGDTDVQGLAAFLFQAVGNKLGTPEQKASVYNLAYKAIVNNSSAYDSKAPAMAVKAQDGTERKTYTYNIASDVLGEIIIDLANIHKNGKDVDIFRYSYPTYKPCPYTHNERINIEAKVLYDWAVDDFHRRPIAIHRLSGLATICPDLQTKSLLKNLVFLLLKDSEADADKYADEPKTLKFLQRQLKRVRHYLTLNQKLSSTNLADKTVYNYQKSELVRIEKKISEKLKQIGETQ